MNEIKNLHPNAQRTAARNPFCIAIPNNFGRLAPFRYFKNEKAATKALKGLKANDQIVDSAEVLPTADVLVSLHQR